MKAVITDFEPISIGRISQLTNKSNQFNLTTKRCTEEDIRNMQEDKNYICLCGRLVDKFGDNGIVTVVAGETKGVILHIRLWLMSCRVLKRGMEDAMMNTLVDLVKKRGLDTIKGYYYPTAKNNIVKDFYKEMRFSKIEEDSVGNSVWEMSVEEYTMRDTEITL